MTPLVSILIPSRFRFDRLKLAIQSFLDTGNPGIMEFIIRLHDNDPDSVSRADELLHMGAKISAVLGPDLKPGENQNVLFHPLVALAAGRWIWPWSDDETIHGNGWCEQLLELPEFGVIAHPEIHQLNESIYQQSETEQGPVPCIPRSALTLLPPPPNMMDVDIDQGLRINCGWEIRLLKGIRVFHDRRMDRTLPGELY